MQSKANDAYSCSYRFYVITDRILSLYVSYKIFETKMHAIWGPLKNMTAGYVFKKIIQISIDMLLLFTLVFGKFNSLISNAIKITRKLAIKR